MRLSLSAALLVTTIPVLAADPPKHPGYRVLAQDKGHVAIVGTDARWNAEYNLQVRDYGPNRTVGCKLLPTRYDLVVAALGGHGELVQSADELRGAIERALASGKPACINVMIESIPAPVVRTRP